MSKNTPIGKEIDLNRPVSPQQYFTDHDDEAGATGTINEPPSSPNLPNVAKESAMATSNHFFCTCFER